MADRDLIARELLKRRLASGSVQAALPDLEIQPYRGQPGEGGRVQIEQPNQIGLNTATGHTEARQRETVSHEAEHLMALRGLGHPYRINKKFDELATTAGLHGPMTRWDLVTKLADAGEHLEKTYGITSAYLDPKMVKFQAHLAPNLLAEQLATLSAAEQSRGINLLDDPVLSRDAFKDPKVREIVSSLVGLRQTRLDAKDLQPYTPMSAQPPGIHAERAKAAGMSEGKFEAALKYIGELFK